MNHDVSQLERDRTLEKLEYKQIPGASEIIVREA